MGDLVTLIKKPRLINPCLVAGWPGMGNVAMVAVEYLKNKLNAELIGEMGLGDYFAPTGATVNKQMIRSPEPPRNEFYAYRSDGNGPDMLFFIGSVQPIPHRVHGYATEILRVAKRFNVQSVYTTAAAPSDMHFRDTPRVFAVPNQQDLLKRMIDYKVHFMGDGNIAGLNGLLISVAAEMGLEGLCLLGEIPFFTAQVEFPRASLMVLSILTQLIGVKIDMMDLEFYANQKEEEIEPLASLLNRPETKTEESQSEENVVPGQEEDIPRHVRLNIEKLFRQAEFDRTYKSKMRLKEELDKWELFEEYLDRFLDLFKKAQGES
jgi:proteasome assembly chaperone (PAC2) family protein